VQSLTLSFLQSQLAEKGSVELVSFNRSFPMTFFPDGALAFTQYTTAHHGSPSDLLSSAAPSCALLALRLFCWLTYCISCLKV